MWSFLRRKKRNKKLLIPGDGAVGKTSLFEDMKRVLPLENIYKEQDAVFKAKLSGKSTNESQDLYLRTEFFNSVLDQVEINYLETLCIQ